MDTADIPLKGPSDWRAEPNPASLAVVGKLGEEAAELASRCCRAVIQGVDALDPDSGRTNKDHLQDEIADVLALIKLARDQLRLDWPTINRRMDAKVYFKRPWIEALRALERTNHE